MWSVESVDGLIETAGSGGIVIIDYKRALVAHGECATITANGNIL